MDNITANETWIDKLVDELIDTKDEISSLKSDRASLDVLVDIILDNSRLDYGGEGLRIEDESAIFAYLRAISYRNYSARLAELREEREAKEKAIETLESDMYKGILSEGDFWILMNATKSGKMAYTGLIISHNGCLKINDVLPADKRFKPSCVQLDKDGYNGSLVYSYSNDDQGIFEVGEVSLKNCTNSYPYAMALKRCMDRVILKNSKLAYSGIYSDSEAEEFKNEPKEPKETKTESSAPVVVLPEGKSARQALVDYCKEVNLDIVLIAKRYKLNNDSTDDEFINALSHLKAIKDSYKEA